MSKKDICSYNYDELKEEMLVIGEKAFRSKQIYEWLHVKLADDFDEMTNLSKALREKLKEEYVILPVKMLERQISQIDGTNKFLFFGKRIPPLCPKGYLGIVTGYHATTQFWFCNMSYHSHSGDSSDNVVLFERYGKKQFIILASIQCSSHQIHIKFLRHSCRLVIDRYPVFIYTAAHMTLRTDVQ